MAGDLLVLAEKYVALTGEIEDVRRAMLSCLTNGAGEIPLRPRPPARRRPGGSQQHPNAAAAAAAERKTIELLRSSPGLGTAAIAKATGAKVNTTSERLKRLQARGQVARADGGGWSAAASP
jgi:hypothetical protein